MEAAALNKNWCFIEIDPDDFEISERIELMANVKSFVFRKQLWRLTWGIYRRDK
jgi:hypothetical protein